jgi:hypothetical protein
VQREPLVHGGGDPPRPRSTPAAAPMSTPRLAPLAALLLLPALAACSGTRVRPGATPPIAPTEAPPPVPDALAEPRPGPQDGLRGVYRLVEVGDSAVPAVAERRGECVVRVVTGSLSLEGGDFAFSATTQESCAGRTRAPVSLRASGRYEREGGALLLQTREGGAFTTARVRIVDDRLLQLVEMATAAGARGGSWEFRREDPPRG